MKMKIPKHIEESLKDTVGYAEADNKESFLVGSQVAFSKSEDYFTEVIDKLKSDYEIQIKNLIHDCQGANTDMKTIVGIFNKYNDIND